MIKNTNLAGLKVLCLYPNARSISLVPPSFALFSRLLKDRCAEVSLFDTSFYDLGESDSDKAREENLTVHPVEEGELEIPLKETDVFEDLIQTVNAFKPDLILVTATDSTIELSIELLRCIRHLKIPTLLGGVFATFAPEKAIRFPEIDMICIGEGEEPLIELCSRLVANKDYFDIPSLWIKRADGTIIRNKRGPVTDIDALPPLDFGIFDERRLFRMMGGKIYKMLPIETHRGCPYPCTFCGSPTQKKMYLEETNSHFYREKSLDIVARDIAYYVEKWQPEYLFFWADTFFAYSEEKISQFCEMYAEYGIPFFCQARPETITDYKVKKLKEVGLERLCVGIEHGNEQFRKDVIKRNYTNSKVIEALEIVTRNQVPLAVNNIIGFPDETPELAMDTVELNRQLAGFEDASCSIFQPYYGTPLRELAIQKGYLHPDALAPHDAADSLLNMPQFPKEKISGLSRVFSLYIRLPKNRWDEIKVAENFTDEGNAMFYNLREEVKAEFFSE